MYGGSYVVNSFKQKVVSQKNDLFATVTLLLRPVAQLYGQVRMLWNQCIVIDCSLTHPAGHKPFTCSHCVCMYHVTSQSRLVLDGFFCLHFCACIYGLAESSMDLLSEQCRERVVWLTDRPFFAVWLSLHCGKDKSPFALIVGKCCRYAFLHATQESRAINCTVSPLEFPACFVSQAAASLSNAFAIS